MVKPKIVVSMLSSNFANLAFEAERIIRCGADRLHMDIMTELQLQRSAHSSSDLSPHLRPSITPTCRRRTGGRRSCQRRSSLSSGITLESDFTRTWQQLNLGISSEQRLRAPS